MPKKKSSKKTKITAIVLIFLTFFFTYRSFWRLDISAASWLLDDYHEYYFLQKTVWRNALFSGYVPRQIVYIIPGQREALCEKIKEDIYVALDLLMEERSDMFDSYEFSDDFRSVTLFVRSGYTGDYDLNEIDRETYTYITFMIPLYHDIKDNGVGGFHKIIRYIESGQLVE
jgi:hypothetical protein